MTIWSLLPLTGCGIFSENPTNSRFSSFHHQAHLAAFVKNGVQVNIALEIDNYGQWIIAVTYRPLQEGFHLYSKDFPQSGIDGVGRPTWFKVLSPQVEAVSELVADAPAQSYDIPGFDEPFLMYPVGPVTLRQVIELPPANNLSNHLKLSIGYMICSENGVCLPPVVGYEVDLNIITEMEDGS